MTSISAAQTALHQHQEQFLALANKAYLNYGGQGPMPQPAINAIHQAQIYIRRLLVYGA